MKIIVGLKTGKRVEEPRADAVEDVKDGWVRLMRSGTVVRMFPREDVEQVEFADDKNA